MASLEGQRIGNNFTLGMADSAGNILQRQSQCLASAAALGASDPGAGTTAAENCRRTTENALNMLAASQGKELCDDGKGGWKFCDSEKPAGAGNDEAGAGNDEAGTETQTSTSTAMQNARSRARASAGIRRLR